MNNSNFDPLTAMRFHRLTASLAGIVSAALVSISPGAFADEPPVVPLTGGKLLLTGGVSQVEGAAGGGLVPWAVIGGYGSAQQIGTDVHGTYVHTQDYALGTYGVLVGVANRVEFSLARQTFDSLACKIEFAGMDPTTQSGADVNAHLSQVCSARVEVEA
ncbi:DUF3034 family protein [Candidatus Burkholderia verschuerenii]|uniref:DUF3034 family protein n=1 Tax=Candidatus Burkholderia verschuerenii TaxID=242163 RepID=UPI001E5A1FF9|nr:DUF3034 family protein [Candidatus Burkholderia verschuerenii]